MAKVELSGVFFRLCPKCSLLIHPTSIKFDVSYSHEYSVEIEGMCGHGHRFEYYEASEYGIEKDVTKIDWISK